MVRGPRQNRPVSDRLLDVLLRPAMPSWLVSALVHLVGLLVLALIATGAKPHGTGGLSLLVAEAPGLPGDDAAEAFGIDVAPSGGSAAAAGQVAASGSAAAGLAAVLGDQPPSDPTRVLPAALAALGSGALEGGGIGSATGMGSGTGPGSGSGSGRGGGYGKGRTSVFGTQGEGYKFVYVFDRSASMGGSGRNALAASKVELLASLKHLQQTHQFQIVFYNETPTIFNPTGDPNRLLFATEENKAAAAKFIASIYPDDGTNHQAALMLAIQLRPDVIFLLTDADEPKLSPAQLARIQRLAAGITINAIEFGLGPRSDADNFLVRLARETGGSYAYVDVSKIFPAQGQ